MSRRGDFRFLGEIGRGSFGKVDKVRRKIDGKICCCKQISLDMLKSQKQREQALNEARIMRQLSCPYIVEYLDAFTEKDNLFLILEFCSAGDLKGFLKKAKVLPDRSIWRYFLRITLGIEYLHGKRILHRDLKSENIFLCGSDENLRVGDLGLSRILSSSASGASTLVGTPRYLSPEEVKGNSHYNDKCDVWSLGVILYELCSDGHKGPFDQACKLPDLMKAICEGNVPPLPARVEQLKEIVGMLLDKSGTSRPSVSQILASERVVENGERHGVWESKDAGADKGNLLQNGSSLEGAGRSVAADSRLPGGATRPASAPRERVRGPAEMPDGCGSRLAKVFGMRDGESGLGARFKRLSHCEICLGMGAARTQFGTFFRRHHCRSCGRSVCGDHSNHARALPQFGYTSPQRICEICSHMPSDCGLEAPSRGLLVVAMCHERRAYIWNSSRVGEYAWTAGAQLRWVGMSASSVGASARALCTLELGLAPVFDFRALDRRGSELPRVAMPLPTEGPFSKKSSHMSVDLAASCGRWVAVLLTLRGGSLISIADVTSGKCVGNSSGSGDKVSALALHSGEQSPHEGFMVTGSENGAVRVWGVPGSADICELRCVLLGHKDAVICIAVGCNANFICTGSKDNTVRLWRRQQGTNTFAANTPAVCCESFRPTGPSALCCDGARLVFVQAPRPPCVWEQGVSVWDLSLGKHERSIGKKDHSVNCVCLRGTMLATSSATSNVSGCVSIQLWHAPTGTALSTLMNPAQVTSLLLTEPDDEPPS